MRPHTPPKGVILDLGDVLFTWSPTTRTKIPAQMMRDMLSSVIWERYECGLLVQGSCYDQLAQQFCVSVSEVAEAFDQARESLQPNHAMISFIHDLKSRFRESISMYAMSNISIEDYAVLSTKLADWSVFDQVFTSGYVGMRKPDPEFFRHVLQRTNLAPEEAFFVDDKTENVMAAKSLGIDGIVFDNNTLVAHTLERRIYSPIDRAVDFLSKHARPFDSVTDTGVVVLENFSQSLILDVMQDRNLVNVAWGSRRTWNYFIGEPVLVPGGYFPDDLDTTALALTVLRPVSEMVNSLLEEMLSYQNPDGTFQVSFIISERAIPLSMTYYDRKKPRIDAVVSVNVLACFYTFGRGHDLGLERTLQMAHDVLLHREYLQGTRYYPSPDCCLFFFGRLLRCSDDDHLHTMLGPLLRESIQERVGQSGNALDLAMRALACKWLGLGCGDDCHTLLDMQCEDGGWDAGWICSYGSTRVKIGNRGVTTAIAIKALKQ